MRNLYEGNTYSSELGGKKARTTLEEVFGEEDDFDLDGPTRPKKG